MARYPYFCQSCGKQFEIEKPMADAAKPAACPDCQAVGSRVFTAPGISIKGAPVAFKPAECGNESQGCSGCCSGGCDLN